MTANQHNVIYIVKKPSKDPAIIKSEIQQLGYRVKFVSDENELLSVLKEKVKQPEHQAFTGNQSGMITQNESIKEGKNKITDREKQILEHIYYGYTSEQTAEALKISRRTVESHRANLLQKTHTRNTADLIRYALQQGILK